MKHLPSLALAVVAFVSVASVARADDTIGPPPPPPARATARVHIKGPRPSYLYRRDASTGVWSTACETPCDAEMPIGDTYRIGGNGFRTTAEFTLDAEPGAHVEYSVDGPNWFGIIGGGVLAIAGGSTGYVGLRFAVDDCADTRYGSACKDRHNVGLGLFAIGAVALGLGLAIVYPSLKTDLARKDQPAAKDAFLRTPTWRTASAAEDTGPPITMPLAYEGRF